MQAKRAVRYVQVTAVEGSDSPSIHALGASKDSKTHRPEKADSPLMTQSEQQSVLHDFKDRFPETLPDGYLLKGM